MPGHVVQLVQGLATGGLERVVLDLSAGLVQRGARVTVCCFDREGELAPAARAAGVNVQLLPRQPGVDLKYPFKLAAAMRTWQATAIHMHNGTALFYGAIAARKAALPVRVYTEHDGVFPRGRVRAWVDRRLVGTLTQATAVSQAVKDLWCRHDRIDPAAIAVIHNGVAANPQPRTASRPTDEIRIACVGRLSQEKGIDILLHALAEFRGQTPKFTARLAVVGDGPLREELETLARQLGVDATFMGWRDDVPALLGEMDMLVLPSRSEGLPLALLEAMAAALPAVAADVGGVREAAIDGKTALLVPPGQPSAMAAAIARLCGDAPLRTAMGQAALQRFNERFELSKMIDAYARLLMR